MRLEAKAYLHKGLKIVFSDEAAETEETFEHAGGIAEFLAKLVAERGKAPTAPQVFYFERAGRGRVPHRGGAAVDRVAPTRRSARTSTASRPRTAARTSRASRAAIVKAVRNFIETHEPRRPRA